MKYSISKTTVLRKSLYIYVILVSTANAQIMYNKVKPVSSESQIFKQIQELPIIDFPVEQNGSMFQSNLKVNVKQKAFFESASGKNIARMMIKVNAQSLGNITVSFKDVLLENSSYCLVYTQDHQIVAGPIYQKSISNNQFTIMNIPASELILEVIYKDKNDFTMLLDEVSFQSIVNLNEIKKKKQQEKFLTSACDSFGVVSFLDNVVREYYNSCSEDSLTDYGCKLMGYINKSDFSHFTKLNSINDPLYSKLDVSRASCMIMMKDETCENDTIPDTLIYHPVNGTLINLPSQNCDDSYVITVQHEVVPLMQAYIDEDFDVLDKVVIRFNWHYKYGTPYQLFNIDCNASENNFNLWRQQFDFNEVIDYQGVEVFATGKLLATYLYTEDWVIFKLKCKPFYKEHHLGWSSQFGFDMKEGDKILTWTERPSYDFINSNDFKVIGRRKLVPTQVFDNYRIILKATDYRHFQLIENWSSNLPSRSGYSGSIFTGKDYINSEQKIGLGVVRTSADVDFLNPNGNYKMVDFGMISFDDILNANTYPYNVIPQNYHTLYEYLEGNLFELNYDTIQYTKHTQILTDEFIWYPPMENKEKCPSIVNQDSICDFDINDYLVIDTVGNEICFTISNIPTSKFPNSSILPKGFRIFHNFGTQKLIKWESFQDNQDISFPIEFCLTKCEMMDLLPIGKSGIDIGIEFYDGDGNVYNNPGCDSMNINYEFPSFCELFDVSITKIDSVDDCCIYEIELTTDFDFFSLEECDNNPHLGSLLDSLYFDSSLENEPMKLGDLDSLIIDSLNGIIVFRYQKCADSLSNESNFRLILSNRGEICEIQGEDIPFCTCLCPENVNDWVEVNTFPDANCGSDRCRIELNLKIPSIYDCYQFFSINSPLKQSIPPHGNLLSNNPCVAKGTYKEYEIKLFKDPFDENPCIINTSAFCPLEFFNKQCYPDCEEDVFHEEEPLTFDIPGCDDCEFKVYYSTRITNCEDNPGKYDVQINMITSQSTDTLNPNACSDCTVSETEIYKNALFKIIHKNVMGFPPTEFNDECDTNWRVVNSSCWAHYNTIDIGYGGLEHYNPVPIKVYAPCDSVECCTIGLKVCRMQDSSIVVTTLQSNNPQENCISKFQTVNDGTGPEGEIYECENRCDWIFALNGTYYGKPVIKIDNELIRNELLQIEKIQFIDFIELKIISQIESNNFEIIVTNLQGKNLIYQPKSINKGYNTFNINTSNLLSGIYFIQLKVDGSIVSSSKFTIIK